MKTKKKARIPTYAEKAKYAAKELKVGHTGRREILTISERAGIGTADLINAYYFLCLENRRKVPNYIQKRVESTLGMTSTRKHMIATPATKQIVKALQEGVKPKGSIIAKKTGISQSHISDTFKELRKHNVVADRREPAVIKKFNTEYKVSKNTKIVFDYLQEGGYLKQKRLPLLAEITKETGLTTSQIISSIATLERRRIINF